MTNEEKMQYWINLSDYDLETAEAMMNTKRFLYVGFMCHQVIEKIFKAGYVKIKNETPPFSHDLPRLADLADFYDLLTNEQKLFLNALNPLNIEARYPDYKEKLKKLLTDERCKQIFEQTKQLQQWTKEKILLKK